MGKNKNTSLKDIIEKGLETMYTRLLDRAMKEDRELVVGGGKGNPILVKASILKARLK